MEKNAGDIERLLKRIPEPSEENKALFDFISHFLQVIGLQICPKLRSQYGSRPNLAPAPISPRPNYFPAPSWPRRPVVEHVTRPGVEGLQT